MCAMCVVSQSYHHRGNRGRARSTPVQHRMAPAAGAVAATQLTQTRVILRSPTLVQWRLRPLWHMLDSAF